jgi:hypothetical protein
MELWVRALETILVEKGYVETAALDRIVELYETKIGPHIGAQVIAEAWSDLHSGSRCEDASKAVSTLVQVGRQAWRGDQKSPGGRRSRHRRNLLRDWLVTLERIVAEKGVTTPQSLAELTTPGIARRTEHLMANLLS